MKILGLILAVTVLIATGCAADHNDAVLPGCYDGYHKPIYPSYYGVQPSNADGSVTNAVGIHSDDSNDDDVL